ncbi:major facilitator superfamily domain-containing protein [Zychaea mexicana]|uniref:major facilitator superfamily domain-containing protein n=1 Tax=Zychaea mexicana TaxID=64656 RepID=UPI0022FF1002|nr:major facilitator superfamily domain-containing protein [Zychaea mexicana]KAI9488139.1 major facilitator superfamily domain-containing protein [Zychaea mexicana]
MLFPKALYVCVYSIYGSAIAYLALFYDEALHLPSNQIGVLLAITPFIQSLSCPLWTVVVDRKPQWHGYLMSALAIIGGSGVMALLLLPGWLVQDVDDGNNGGNTMVTFAAAVTLALIFAFFGQPVSTLVDSAVLKMLGDQKILYGNQRLWGSVSNGLNILLVGLWVGVSGIQVAFYVFAFGVTSFAILASFTKFSSAEESDVHNADWAAAHNNNNEDDEHQGGNHNNSRQPLLRNSLSFNRPYNAITGENGAPPIASSYLTSLTGALSIGTEVDALPRRDSLASYANTEYYDDYYDEGRRLGLLRTTTTAMDVQHEASQRIANMDHLPPLGLALSNIPTIDTTLAAFADLGRPESKAPEKSTLRSPRISSFLLTMMLFGVSYSMIAQFLFLILRNDLGIDSSLIGWTGPIAGIAEVMTFWLSNKLLEEFNVASLIGFSHVGIIMRNLIYTWITPGQPMSTVIALGMHLVNGSAYALLWSTAVSEADAIFPPDQRAVAQGILASLFTGLGYGIGCIAGGAIYNQLGAVALCNSSAAVAALSLVVFLCGRSMQ